MTIIQLYDPLINLLNWDWLENLTFVSVLIRLLLATILGGILGLERARKNQAAGLRTHILVTLGATIAMLTNEFICLKTGSSDGARLGAQVISGIGFLGAGTILVTSRNQIKGLTTAAGLWACACLGLAIGIGFYTVAIIAWLIIVLVFVLLPKFEKVLIRKSNYFEIHIEFGCRENMREFINYAREKELKVISIERNPAYSASGLSVYSIVLSVIDKKNKIHSKYIEEFSKLDYVKYVEEIR